MIYMNGNIDFTQGKPSRAILRFFFPMLATGMLQQFYTFADTAIVGRGLDIPGSNPGRGKILKQHRLVGAGQLAPGFFQFLGPSFRILLLRPGGQRQQDGE